MSSVSSPLSQRFLKKATMATAATLQSGQPTANRRIFSILQGSVKISQELREILEPAAEAFCTKSYKTAAKYYNSALDSWTVKDEKRQNQIIVLTKYMLCICWLESKDAKHLLDALRNLKELEKSYGYEYPMLYYAVGKAYFKLYRFNEADEVLKKGFSVLNGDMNVNEYNIPGTNIVIPESSREKLVAALVTLNEQCSSWHRPDAVCCMPDCSSHSHNEGIDKHIFFGSPTFSGMVQVSCNNPNVCIMNFHTACWKAKKEQLCSLGKMSDKDLLNWECFTPNCENQGVRCTIKKIEIYDENAKSKSVKEAHPEEVVWQTKPNPPPKGAIRKQQHQTPKVKVPSAESRPAPYERQARPHTVPNNVPTHNNTLTHRAKIEENEEDDDIHDEQALKASIEKLQELRANNFGIKDDEIWRPDLQMYGNEYMLSTAELIPDPDFSYSGVEEADLMSFFFSYFFEYISANGPVKLDDLDEKWNEAQKEMNVNSDAVLKHYLDISEFLLQSVKFAVIGDYICVAGKLPEAYELAKNDTCEILRFFMENDIDQRSNSSSVDDEAAFDAIINQEKNNNSLPYSPLSVDDTVIAQESSVISNPASDIHNKKEKKSINDLKATHVVASSPPSTPKTSKIKSLSKSASTSQENGKITAPEIIEASKTIEEKKLILPSETPAADNVTVESPNRKSEKRPYSPDSRAAAIDDEKSEPSIKKPSENRDESSTKVINGIHNPDGKEDFVFPPLKSSFSFEKFTQLIEPKFNFAKGSKSTNDLRAAVASLADNHNLFMNNSGEPDDRSLDTRKRPFITPHRRIEANPSKPEYEKVSDSHEFLNKIFENLTAELIEHKGERLLLESELEHEKKAHAAMRVRMLQKSLHSQYAYDHSTITMKIEECRKNIEVCAGIQSMLKNSICQNLPNYGAEWTKVMTELEQISKNHEKKFNEIHEQLYTTKEPEKLEEVNLQLEPLPVMPQTKLIDVMQVAFDLYRSHHMREFQRMQVSIPSASTPAIRPPQSQSKQQSPPMISTSQPWQSNLPDYYAGHQLIHGLAYQQNGMRNLPSQNVYMPSQRNSANSVPPHLQVFRNVPPPTQNFQYYPNPYTGIPYPPVNPSVPQVQQISSAAVQKQVFNASQQSASESSRQNVSPALNNSSSAHQIASPVHQITRPLPERTPSPNFLTPERPKSNSLIQAPSPLLSDNVANTVDAFNQLFAKFKKGSSSSVTPELPTVSSPNVRSSTPVLTNSTSVANEQNFERSTTANPQRANSVPEIPKIFTWQEGIATMVQKTKDGQETKENITEPESCVEQFKQLDLNKKDQPFVAPVNNGAKKKKQNLNSNILQAPPLFRDEPQVNTQNNIDRRVAEDLLDFAMVSKSETVFKGNEKRKDTAAVIKASNVAPKEAKPHQKSVHSMDKLLKRMRKQYAGVLELDLLKGVEFVRKKHNNSLSGVPISEIICEADKYILDRQRKQLCGYVKRMPYQYCGTSNATDRSAWMPMVEEERKKLFSVSSTNSASSLKKESQNLSSSKKKWEPVVQNDGWQKTTLESDCSICLDTMRTPRLVLWTLPCQHTFHKKCIKDWHVVEKTCPNCRKHSTIDDEYPPLPLG